MVANRRNSSASPKHSARKIGQLAKEAGVSVRTVRYYEEIGLLSPSSRTASGHRIYDTDASRRLQTVNALRRLGLSLTDIRQTLQAPEREALPKLERQITKLRNQINTQRQACSRAEIVATALRSNKRTTAEKLVDHVRKLSILELYLTSEQLEQIRLRRELLGNAGARKLRTEFQQLIQRFRSAMRKGLPPTNACLRGYGQRWLDLVKLTVGTDEGVLTALKLMCEREPPAALGQGIDSQLLHYISAAMPACQKKPRDL